MPQAVSEGMSLALVNQAVPRRSSSSFELGCRDRAAGSRPAPPTRFIKDFRTIWLALNFDLQTDSLKAGPDDWSCDRCWRGFIVTIWRGVPPPRGSRSLAGPPPPAYRAARASRHPSSCPPASAQAFVQRINVPDELSVEFASVRRHDSPWVRADHKEKRREPIAVHAPLILCAGRHCAHYVHERPQHNSVSGT